ncbi:hypothetical protein D3C72_1723080 [compost metagenome]
MHRHQLAEDVGGQLADLQAVFGQGATDVVAVVLAVGGGGQVEQARVPCRNLQGLEAMAGGPGGDAGQAVERRLVASELRQMQAGAFEGLHVLLQLFVSRQRIGACIGMVNTRVTLRASERQAGRWQGDRANSTGTRHCARRCCCSGSTAMRAPRCRRWSKRLALPRRASTPRSAARSSCSAKR